VVGASGAAQQASVRKQQQAGRSSRACVHCRMHADEAGEGLARRREQIECTQLQLSGSARTAGILFVFTTPSDPIGFRTSTRDVEAQSAAKEHISEARGDDRGPGVRWPGADLGQRWSR